MERGEIIAIPKPNSKDIRGIGLVEDIWKVVSKIMTELIQKGIQCHQELHGFRAESHCWVVLQETEYSFQTLQWVRNTFPFNVVCKNVLHLQLHVFHWISLISTHSNLWRQSHYNQAGRKGLNDSKGTSSLLIMGLKEHKLHVTYMLDSCRTDLILTDFNPKPLKGD